MAFIDLDLPSLVLRMVYDGPALAGKTTNLEALAERLGQEIYSGEEADGRTLYLDWVDYVGGSFEGMPIRCQLVSVPGQRILQSRRRWLLEEADVVVFVADSRPEQAGENARAFALLREVLLPKSPPVGVVVQANKRDVVGALGLDALRQQLAGGQPLAMTESIATEADGVRDTFVFAVRLALDRVRALRQLGQLETRAPEVEDGPQLVETLRRAEQQAQTAASGSTELDGVTVSEVPSKVSAVSSLAAPTDSGKAPAPSTDGRPALPDVMLPLGQVWPPVHGRILIHEATRESLSELARSGDDGWLAESPRCRVQSPVGGVFDDRAAGQAALQAWIDWHLAMGTCLTGGRCLALSQEGDSRWRLWQIVSKQPTLGEVLTRRIRESEAESLGQDLFRLLELGEKGRRKLMTCGELERLKVTSMAWQDGTACEDTLQFADLAPFPPRLPEDAADSAAARPTALEDFTPILRRELARRPGMVTGVLRGFREVAEARNQGAVLDALREILLAS